MFGINVVDDWLICVGTTTDSLNPEPLLNQQEFYFALAEDLIVKGNTRQMRNTLGQGTIDPNCNASNNYHS